MNFFLFLGMTMETIEKVSRYDCNFCDRQFNYEDLLNKHQKAAHQFKQNAKSMRNSNQSDVQQNSSFKCNVCQKGFAKNYKLKRHFDAVHLKIKSFQCGTCNKSFGQKTDLISHIHNIHSNQMDIGKPNECKSCESAFRKSEYLIQHIKRVHSDDKPHTCDKCDKDFAEKVHLNEHIKNVHHSENKKLCHKCNKLFSSRKKLVRHNSMVHLNLRPYSCNICEKSFKLKEHLKRHSSVHKNDASDQVLQLKENSPTTDYNSSTESTSVSNEKQFEEPQDEEFHQISTHPNKNFKCNICNKEFKGKKHLSQHTKFVHDKLENHECSKCGKTFVNISKLKRHDSVVHQKIKPFSCKKCKFSFALKSDLNRHLLSRSHENVITSQNDVTSIQDNSENEEEIVATELLQEYSQTIENEELVDTRDHLEDDQTIEIDQELNVQTIPQDKEFNSTRVPRLQENKKKHECETCGKTFPKKSKLMRHFNGVHLKIKSSKCNQCGKEFRDKTVLNTHIKVIHDKIKDQACDMCDKRFYLHNDLKIHKDMVHMKIKHHSCNFCHMKFTLKQHLKRHMLTHESQGNSSKTKDSVPTISRNFGHLQNVEEINPSNHLNMKPNACGVCSKRFSTSRDLKRHNDMVHLKIKPFSCNQCQMKFTLKQHLKRHKLTHKSEGNISKSNSRSVSNEHYQEVQNDVEIEQSNSFENVTYLDEKESDSDDCIFDKKIIIEENGNDLSHDNEKNFQCTSCGKGFYERYMLIKHYDTIHRGNVTLIVNVLKN